MLIFCLYFSQRLSNCIQPTYKEIIPFDVVWQICLVVMRLLWQL